MIVNRRTKFCIYTPFKNYSSSIIDFFNQWNCYTRFLGSNPHYSWEPTLWTNPHSATVPEMVMQEGWKRYLPIRNPYDRVISQWKWHIQMENDAISFDEWLMLHSKQAVQMPVTIVYPQYTHLIKCENIIEEFLNNEDIYHGDGPDRFDVLKNFPHTNKSLIKKSIELTQRQQDIIYYYHYMDFIVGDYSKNYNPS